MNIIVGILIIVLLFLLVLSIIFNITFYNSPAKEKRRKPFSRPSFNDVSDKIDSIVQNLKKADYEDVFITSHDGLRLRARYYHNVDNAPIAIMAHGYRSHSINDSGGAYKTFTHKGYNILIPDQRAHGKSEGNTITFGIKEHCDFINWLKYVSERFGDDTPIILMGVSMGAATVLMMSDKHLPGNVAGIIADCGYTSPKEIISKVMKEDMHLSPKVFYPLVRLSALMFGKFDPDEFSPIEAVKSSRYPILIIHGEDDGFVPYIMAKVLYSTCNSKKYLLSVPGADHGISYVIDEQAYNRSVDDFIFEISKDLSN